MSYRRLCSGALKGGKRLREEGGAKAGPERVGREGPWGGTWRKVTLVQNPLLEQGKAKKGLLCAEGGGKNLSNSVESREPWEHPLGTCRPGGPKTTEEELSCSKL